MRDAVIVPTTRAATGKACRGAFDTLAFPGLAAAGLVKLF